MRAEAPDWSRRTPNESGNDPASFGDHAKSRRGRWSPRDQAPRHPVDRRVRNRVRKRCQLRAAFAARPSQWQSSSRYRPEIEYSSRLSNLNRGSKLGFGFSNPLKETGIRDLHLDLAYDLLQILIDQRPSVEIARNRSIDLRQLQRWKVLLNGLRRIAIVERVHDRIQRDPHWTRHIVAYSLCTIPPS